MNKERIHIEGEFSLQRRSNPNKRLTKIGFMQLSVMLEFSEIFAYVAKVSDLLVIVNKVIGIFKLLCYR